MEASAETHASDGRRSSDCVVVVRKCFRACRRYSCRTEHTSAPSMVAIYTFVNFYLCWPGMCGEVFQPPTRARCLDHLSAAPCLFQSLQPCRQLVVGRKRCTCVCGAWNPNSSRIHQCGDEPDCGLRREADETTDSLDNQGRPLKRSPEDDSVTNVQ